MPVREKRHCRNRRAQTHRPMARCRFDHVERRPRCVDHQLAPWKVTARWRCPLSMLLFVPFAACYEPPKPDTATFATRPFPTGAAVLRATAFGRRLERAGDLI